MYECCGRTFGSQGIRQHLDNSYAHLHEIECRWCYARFPKHEGNRRLRHEKKYHWHHCDDCEWIFSSKAGLEEHIEEEHPPNYCYGCQRSFSSPNNLNMHLKSSTHVGKNVKCPWCPNKFTNLTGICLHLESGTCASGITRAKINQYCRQVDPDHVFTTKRIGWHDDDERPAAASSHMMASSASWDGSCYRCYFCPRGFNRLISLNQHLASPVHEERIYRCPKGCRREYTALSGLINHLESESCGRFRAKGTLDGLLSSRRLRITG